MMEERSAQYLRRSLWVSAFCYLLVFGVLGFFIGPFDFDHIGSYYDIAWRFWRHDPGFPEFNPLLCGGRTLGADPQTPIFTPIVLLVPLLGPIWTIKIEMLAWLALGLYGVKLCLEHLGVGKQERLWGYFLYLTSGAIVSRFLVGHVALAFFFTFPLFIGLSYRLSEGTSLKGQWKLLLAYGALFIASGAYKPNFIIIAGPLLLVEHAVRAFVQKKPRVLILYFAALGLCVLANAPTYLPAANYFSMMPRSRPHYFSMVPLYALFANLLMPLKSIPKAWLGTSLAGTHEYSVYLGPLGVYFAYLGVKNWPKTLRAERAGLLALAVVAALWGMGTPVDNDSLWIPYNVLRAVWPGFNSLRVPQRLWIGVFIALLLFSARGFTLPKTKRAFWVLLLVAIVPGLASAVINLSKAATRTTQTQWTAPYQYNPDFQWVQGDPDDTYRYTREGLGVIACLYNIEVAPAPEVTPGRHLRATTNQAGQVNAKWLGWNRFEVETKMAKAPFTVAFNLNHSPLWKWKGNTGGVSSDLHQPLTLTSDTTELKGVLTFETPYVKESVVLALLTYLAFAGLILGLRRYY